MAYDDRTLAYRAQAGLMGGARLPTGEPFFPEPFGYGGYGQGGFGSSYMAGYNPWVGTGGQQLPIGAGQQVPPQLAQQFAQHSIPQQQLGGSFGGAFGGLSPFATGGATAPWGLGGGQLQQGGGFFGGINPYLSQQGGSNPYLTQQGGINPYLSQQFLAQQGGVNPLLQGGISPQLQGGMTPFQGQGGINPFQGQGGINPFQSQSGMNPYATQGGINPYVTHGGISPQLSQTGIHPALLQSGFNPALSQLALNPFLAQGGINPYLTQAGVINPYAWQQQGGTIPLQYFGQQGVTPIPFLPQLGQASWSSGGVGGYPQALGGQLASQFVPFGGSPLAFAATAGMGAPVPFVNQVRLGQPALTGRPPKGFKRSDDRIQDEIAEHLTRLPQIDVGEIELRVQNGEVTLTGTATDRETKRIVEDVAEQVLGVQDVRNEIKVQPSPGMAQRPGAESPQAAHQVEGRPRGRTQT